MSLPSLPHAQCSSEDMIHQYVGRRTINMRLESDRDLLKWIVAHASAETCRAGTLTYTAYSLQSGVQRRVDLVYRPLELTEIHIRPV